MIQRLVLAFLFAWTVLPQAAQAELVLLYTAETRGQAEPCPV